VDLSHTLSLEGGRGSVDHDSLAIQCTAPHPTVTKSVTA
jgi:hypothetical protein